MKNILETQIIEHDHQAHRVVVRVSTSYWSSSRGIHQRRDIVFLRRQCRDHNQVEEEINQSGSDDVWKKMENIDTCKDGLYEICMTNILRDHETGYVEDWSYKLVPFVV